MYRGEARPCSACGVGLTLLPARLPAWGCTACGGVWLGPEAAVHVMRGLGDDVESELAAVSNVTARASLLPPVSDSGARTCPTCDAVMARLKIGEVIVDSCSAHGTWFDRDEVARVVEVCGSLRKRHLEGDSVDLVSALGLFLVGAASLVFGGVMSVAQTAAMPRGDEVKR